MTVLQSVSNYTSTILSDNVFSNDTCLRVADASKFPTEFPFPILCVSEIMKCIATDVTQGLLRVERSQEGTTATDYMAGTNISTNITKKNINDLNALSFHPLQTEMYPILERGLPP
jgi:hypothetical protein